VVFPLRFSPFVGPASGTVFFPGLEYCPAPTLPDHNAPAGELRIDLAVLVEELPVVIAGQTVRIIYRPQDGPLKVGAGLAFKHVALLRQKTAAIVLVIIGALSLDEVIQCGCSLHRFSLKNEFLCRGPVHTDSHRRDKAPGSPRAARSPHIGRTE